MSVEANEPLSIASVLDSGFVLYRASLSRVFAIAAVAALVTAPIGTAVQGFALEQRLGMIFLLMFVALAVSLIFYGAIASRVGSIARGDEISVGRAFQIAFRRAPAALGASLLYFLAVWIGFVLLMIPGVWLGVAFAFCFLAIMIDSRGPIEGLVRSYRLVRGHWWRTAAILTVVGVIVMVVYFVLIFIVGILAVLDPSVVGTQGPWWLDFIIGPLLSGLVTPLPLAMMYASYHDLALRHEGADLAHRVDSTFQ